MFAFSTIIGPLLISENQGSDLLADLCWADQPYKRAHRAFTSTCFLFGRKEIRRKQFPCAELIEYTSSTEFIVFLHK